MRDSDIEVVTEDESVGPSEDPYEEELPWLPPGLFNAEAMEMLWQVQAQRRQSSPAAPDGSLLYLMGTAHFSDSSKKDVAWMIRAVQPDVVVVELCQYRVSVLKMDENTLLKEAKDKVQQAIKQNGAMSDLMQILLLKVSAHITEQLGMAPGGEFREAFKEVIRMTEDVEKCKQDLLEQTMSEMIGEFPALHQTIMAERDIYTLRQTAGCVEAPPNAQKVPAVVVGVVGMGHVPGDRNWEKQLNIYEIMSPMT
ncbi:LOW QUALITY PROTEIN: traB domain-containing protein [Diretmus argenteus]